MPRQEAYGLVQKTAMQRWRTRQPFETMVRAEPEITARLTDGRLAALFDASRYLRHEDMVFKRVFGG
jgi:adenylosuccinate lyase